MLEMKKVGAHNRASYQPCGQKGGPTGGASIIAHIMAPRFSIIYLEYTSE